MSRQRLLSFVRRWWPLLCLGPLVAALVGYIALLQIAPVYQAGTTLLVTRATVIGSGSTDDSAGAEALARTYAEALKTRPVLDEAIQRLGVSMSSRDLGQAVTVRPVTGTPMLRLTVEDKNPQRAADLANTIVAVFSQHNVADQNERLANSRQQMEQLVASLRVELDTRTSQLQQLRASLPAGDPQITRAEGELAQLQATYNDTLRTYENLRLAEAQGTNGVRVVEPAVPVNEPVRPNRLQIMALAIVAGLFVAIGSALAFEYLDDGLRDAQRVAAATGLRVLGSVPRWPAADRGLAGSQAGGPPGVDRATRQAADAYRLLFTSLVVATTEGERTPRVLMVASAAKDEGKSVTAANLAAVLAESGERVILVDADVHRPSQMQRFGVPNSVGLSTLLASDGVPVDSVLQSTAVPGLWVLPAGPPPNTSGSLFTSSRLSARLGALRRECDMLVIDTPPTLAQSDAALLASHADGVLFVVDARTSRARQVRHALELLRQSGAWIIGVTLNRVPRSQLEYVEYGYQPSGRPGAAESRTAAALGTAAPGKAR